MNRFVMGWRLIGPCYGLNELETNQRKVRTIRSRREADHPSRAAQPLSASFLSTPPDLLKIPPCCASNLEQPVLLKVLVYPPGRGREMNMTLLPIQPVARFYSVVVITRDSDSKSLSRNPGSNPGRTSFSCHRDHTHRSLAGFRPSAIRNQALFVR